MIVHINGNKCYPALGRHLFSHNHHGYSSQVSNGYETSAATDITVPGEEKKKKKKHKKVVLQFAVDS